GCCRAGRVMAPGSGAPPRPVRCYAQMSNRSSVAGLAFLSALGTPGGVPAPTLSVDRPTGRAVVPLPGPTAQRPVEPVECGRRLRPVATGRGDGGAPPGRTQQIGGPAARPAAGARLPAP